LEQANKNPAEAGFLFESLRSQFLLQLGFFVSHMLTRDGIELHDLHLLGHGLLVLGRGVEVTRTGARLELDLVSFACHGRFPLDHFTASTQLSQNDVNAVLVDSAQCSGGDAQAHPTVFGLDPEAAALQVRQKTALGLVIGVGNVIAHHGGFPGHLAFAGHGGTSKVAKRPRL
jgi:hypothetical protein